MQDKVFAISREIGVHVKILRTQNPNQPICGWERLPATHRRARNLTSGSKQRPSSVILIADASWRNFGLIWTKLPGISSNTSTSCAGE